MKTEPDNDTDFYHVSWGCHDPHSVALARERHATGERARDETFRSVIGLPGEPVNIARYASYQAQAAAIADWDREYPAAFRQAYLPAPAGVQQEMML